MDSSTIAAAIGREAGQGRAARTGDSGRAVLSGSGSGGASKERKGRGVGLMYVCMWWQAVRQLSDAIRNLVVSRSFDVIIFFFWSCFWRAECGRIARYERARSQLEKNWRQKSEHKVGWDLEGRNPPKDTLRRQ